LPSLTEVELSRFFLAVVSLLIAALGTGYVFERLRMPRVVGEITGGLALGPSVLGGLAPGTYQWLFAAEPGQRLALDVFYWVGLVLLMFISGFRIQQNLSRDDRHTILVILIAATVPPFALGFAAPSVFDLSPYVGSAGNPLAFRLVLGIAVAVTSIPVISKIFLDLGIIETRFAKIVLGCATLQDLLLWTVLAIATGLASGGSIAEAQGSAWTLARTAGIALVFLGLALWLVPRFLPVASEFRFNIVSRASPTGYTLAVCFVFAALASVLGINVIFGAFIAGIAVGALTNKRYEAVKARIADVSLAFFVPIYFALVGLKIDLPLLLDPLFTLNFIVLTSAIELSCVFVSARWIGKTALISFNLAMAMNTRGGPGIVLASVAYGFGIIDGTFFVTLVLAAVVTSLVSGAWFRIVLKRGLPLYD
jgi:Kef-type K+ transport system membrane component KefB